MVLSMCLVLAFCFRGDKASRLWETHCMRQEAHSNVIGIHSGPLMPMIHFAAKLRTTVRLRMLLSMQCISHWGSSSRRFDLAQKSKASSLVQVHQRLSDSGVRCPSVIRKGGQSCTVMVDSHYRQDQAQQQGQYKKKDT